MYRLTVDDIMTWKPCKTREEITKLFNKRSSLSLLQICDLKITNNDVLWVLVQANNEGALSNILIAFAIYCAESVLPLFDAKYPDDKRPREAIAAAKAYMAGNITLKELKNKRSAASAAYSAANAAAADAAAHAAYAAAYAATNAAAAAYAYAAAAAAYAA